MHYSNMNAQQSFPSEFTGAYFAGAALINLIVADIAQHDAFLHGLASLLTAVAACVSIYFTIRRNRKVSGSGQ